jgi:hypothetical protein
MNECHEKYNSPETLPNSGLQAHIIINPEFQVSSNGGLAIEEDETQQSSKTKGLAGGLSVMFLALIGLAGVVYAKRSGRKEKPQFESEWWKGQHESTWWSEQPDQDIDPNKNLAPISFARQWSYPNPIEDKISWETSNDPGEFHDVVL